MTHFRGICDTFWRYLWHVLELFMTSFRPIYDTFWNYLWHVLELFVTPPFCRAFKSSRWRGRKVFFFLGGGGVLCGSHWCCDCVCVSLSVLLYCLCVCVALCVRVCVSVCLCDSHIFFFRIFFQLHSPCLSQLLTAETLTCTNSSTNKNVFI